MNILHIDSSPRGDRSVSRALAAELMAQIRRSCPERQVVYRDLGQDPVPHVDRAWLEGSHCRPAERSPAARRAMAISDRLVDEVLAADLIVISAPMYNFTVPSTLKAWIDQIVRPGRTFGRDLQGLAGGRRVVVVTARGADYAAGTDRMGRDFQEPLLRAVFAFIGIDDVLFIHAQGIAAGGDVRRRALDAARARIADFVATI